MDPRLILTEEDLKTVEALKAAHPDVAHSLASMSPARLKEVFGITQECIRNPELAERERLLHNRRRGNNATPKRTKEVLLVMEALLWLELQARGSGTH